MAIEANRPLLTYEDYAAMPDDGNRYELIDGEIVMSPSPTIRHQMIRDRLCHWILGYLDAHPSGLAVGDFDTYMTRHTTVRPDFMFFEKGQLPDLTHERANTVAALVIEILSPSNQHRDFGRKRVLYSEHGAKEYWIVHQASPRIDVFRQRRGGGLGEAQAYQSGDVLRSDLLPGLDIAVDDLYRELPAPKHKAARKR